MKRLIGGLIAGGAAIFGGATAIDDHTTRDGSGDIVESGGLGVLAIEIGDCVQFPDAVEVMSVEGVPCDVLHDGQAFAAFDAPAGPFPGLAALDQLAYAGCFERWPEALGNDPKADTVHTVVTFVPTRDGWTLGDRDVLCFVARVDGRRMDADLLRP
jgi:Septum formation